MRAPGWPTFVVCVSGAAGLGWVAGSASDDAGDGGIRSGAAPSDGRRATGPAAPGSDDPARRVADLEREIAALRRASRARAAPPPPGSPPPGAPTAEPFVPGAGPAPEEARRIVDSFLAAMRAGKVRDIPAEVAAAAAENPSLAAVLSLAVTDPALAVEDRAALLRILAEADPEAVAGLLGPMLGGDSDPALRSAALAAALPVASAGLPIPPEVGRVALSHDASPADAESALRALLAAGTDESAAVADRLLDSADPAVRTRAAGALGSARTPSLLPQMTRALRDVAPEHAGQLMNAIASAKDRPWSAFQITGAPDTIQGGDLGTAWAAKSPEMGIVTVELTYAEALRIEQVRVHETLCPGGIVEIAARDGDAWRTVWRGDAPAGEPPRWFEPTLSGAGFDTSALRIAVDTDRAQGWEEIDAVELLGSGRRLWASGAKASSSYAD